MIEILPESSENALGVRLSGTVSVDEYRDTLAKQVTDRVEVHGRYRLLIVLADDFQGFGPGVVLDDPDYGLKHRCFMLQRLALVGAPGKASLGASLVGHLATEWVKTYTPEQLADAWTWIGQHTDREDAVVSASVILGAKVQDHLGETLGTVHDLMLDESTGSIRLVVLAFGGVLGLGEKLHPVPWRMFHVRADGTLLLRLNEIDKSAKHLGQAPAVEKGHVWRADRGTFGFESHPLFGGAHF
ncbi:MAG: PRC-barrel domain-containing protein [Planctomycetes bacterium]|nr:PRC-barrel domain-containing protein [Planctomycetota bacterium]